jgi:soluble lytic murein transglycosylase-like protein
MPVRVRNPRRKILAVLSLLALEAGLAAGPIRTGAEADAAPGRPPAARPAQTVLAAARPASAAPSLASAAQPGPTAAAAATPAAAPAPPAAAPAVAAPAAPPAAPAAVPPATALVPPERKYLQPILEKAARDTGLPKDLVLAQAWAESSWRVDAVSGVGAVGVLQLTPDTVDFVSKNLLHLDHDLDVHDPAANAQMGTVYLKHLLEHTDGDLRKALMAYNQGLRSLYQDGPDPDAQSYADSVLALRPVFAGGV